jgi:CheY-like chemotaxis protein
MAKKKILVIDDEKDFAGLAKMNLELLGDFTVETASSGEEGIALAKKIQPHLIILDILMPGMDGFEVLKMLKQEKATMAIPVVMLSALADQESKLKASQLYDEMYITKPITATDLKEKIEEVLKRIGIK